MHREQDTATLQDVYKYFVHKLCIIYLSKLLEEYVYKYTVGFEQHVYIYYRSNIRDLHFIHVEEYGSFRPILAKTADENLTMSQNKNYDDDIYFFAYLERTLKSRQSHKN